MLKHKQHGSEERLHIWSLCLYRSHKEPTTARIRASLSQWESLEKEPLELKQNNEDI